ncbi:Uncharacterized protein OBRU01_02218 [Operophtera brumata]|uniref:Uncharacterized protein n=1 Tax=Operophtera brumata TaxID=104452 RepID=A0A0L7LSU6_OPEBR|nr:Uncharacterized protein OBRU01_02218 [Operophtera brumata]
MEQAVTRSIERLAGQANYGTWAFAMEMLLIDLDLWDCVSEKFVADSVEAKKKDAKARSKICLMCKENIYPMLMHLKTARDTWQALQKYMLTAGYCDGYICCGSYSMSN